MSSLQRRILDGEMDFSGEEWPQFMYKDGVQNEDDPWVGFMQHELAVKVRLGSQTMQSCAKIAAGIQAFFY